MTLPTISSTSRRRRPMALQLSVLVVSLLAGCATAPALVGTSIAPVTGPARHVLAVDEDGGAPRFVAGEVLIQYTASASQAEQARARNHANAKSAEIVRGKAERKDGKGDIELATLPQGGSVNEAIAALQRNPAVAFAEPNWICTVQAVANDTYYTNGSLWGMLSGTSSPANVYGSGATEAWAAGHTGSNAVYVGVIDEGINVTHQDLAANTWTNPFDPANGVDNNGNGYKDDIKGWDFANNDNSVYDGGNKGTLDSHGTHVAGTIGAKGGNGVGVAGVNWNVTIISAKFLGRNGGTIASAIKATDYLTDLKTRHGLNIVATNNSWGGGGYSQGMYDAVKRANNANILFIAAAGNNGTNNDTTPSYPAGYGAAAGLPAPNQPLPNVISVAAIDNAGKLASFSQYGATTVHLAAPGVGVWSSVPNNTAYASYNGTSMATPHVTGAAALYASSHPTTPNDPADPTGPAHPTTAAEIKAAILAAAIPTPSLAGKCTTGGRLNVAGF